MTMRGLADGLGWSPEGGGFDKVGDVIYWEDGTVSHVDDGVFRVMVGSLNQPRYSLWTDEQRAEAQRAATQARESYHAQCEAHEAERHTLRVSAYAKLTPEERLACDLDDDADDQRQGVPCE